MRGCRRGRVSRHARWWSLPSRRGGGHPAPERVLRRGPVRPEDRGVHVPEFEQGEGRTEEMLGVWPVCVPGPGPVGRGGADLVVVERQCVLAVGERNLPVTNRCKGRAVGSGPSTTSRGLSQVARTAASTRKAFLPRLLAGPQGGDRGTGRGRHRLGEVPGGVP